MLGLYLKIGQWINFTVRKLILTGDDRRNIGVPFLVRDAIINEWDGRAYS